MLGANPEHFYNAVIRHGEKITYKMHELSPKLDSNPTGNDITLYASITPNRANKSIATPDGTYLFLGTSTFDNMEQQEFLIGSYFQRQAQPNMVYMLSCVFPEKLTDKVATIQCIECNEKIDIISHIIDKGYDEYGNPIAEPVYAHKDVDVYMTMYNKDTDKTEAGFMSDAKTFLTIPACYLVSEQNIIMKAKPVYNPETKRNEMKKVPYRVESIDTSMTDILSNASGQNQIVGTLKCYLTEEQDSELNIRQ